MSAARSLDTGMGLGREQRVERAQRPGLVLAERPIVVEKAHLQFVSRLDEAKAAKVACPDVGGHVIGKSAHPTILPQSGA